MATQKGSTIIKDLAELKAILVIGTQATGKTSFLHQVLISLLLKKHPSQIKLILADIKGIEFQVYSQLEKHFLATLPGKENSIIESYDRLIHTLNALCIEMENRYELFKEASSRNIKEYNTKFIERKLDPRKGHQYLPFIIIAIDDLGTFSLKGEKELNLPLQKLVNDGYKAGIFTIISTSQFIGHALLATLLSLIARRVVFNLNNKNDYRRFFDTLKLKTYLQLGEFLYANNNEIHSENSILFDLFFPFEEPLSINVDFSTVFSRRKL